MTVVGKIKVTIWKFQQLQFAGLSIEWCEVIILGESRLAKRYFEEDGCTRVFVYISMLSVGYHIFLFDDL